MWFGHPHYLGSENYNYGGATYVSVLDFNDTARFVTDYGTNTTYPFIGSSVNFDPTRYDNRYSGNSVNPLSITTSFAIKY